MSGTTRAQFLSRGARGGIALAAGGSVLGLAQGTAFGDRVQRCDREARGDRRAARDRLLHQAIASKKLKGDELGYLAAAIEQRAGPLRRAQRRARVGDPEGPEVQVPGAEHSPRAKSIGKLGQALETAFVGAYMGAVTALQSNELKGVAAEIGACESRHLSVLTNIAANSIIPAPDLPEGADRRAGHRRRHAVPRLADRKIGSGCEGHPLPSCFMRPAPCRGSRGRWRSGRRRSSPPRRSPRRSTRRRRRGPAPSRSVRRCGGRRHRREAGRRARAPADAPFRSAPRSRRGR